MRWRNTATCRRTPRRRITSRTCSVRTKSIARAASAFFLTLGLLGVEPVPVTTILAAYDRATHSADVATMESSGTIVGEGLTGVFHSWRANDDERDDERLGERAETSLKRGDRYYRRDASGIVTELTGYLRRRSLTGEFIDSGAFLKAPERSKFIGLATLDGRRAWKLEVNAKDGEPQTLYIDVENGRPLRLEYLDGDGPTDIDYSDWRDVAGHLLPFRTVTTDGDHAFDIVEQTTSVTIDTPIDAQIFAPLVGRTLHADGAQTVPLIDAGTHIACDVSVGGVKLRMLLDSGAQTVLLDSSVVKRLGLHEAGSLEVRGATRSGGLHIVTIPRLDIGTASLDQLVGSSIDLGGATRGQVKLDGILGYPFFATSLVELDFEKRTLRFGPPGSFAPRGTKIPLDLDRGLMEATLRIDDELDGRFLIDTGDNAELLLYEHFVNDHPNVAPFTGKNSYTYGIGGTTSAYLSQLDRIDLGGTSLYRTNVTVIRGDRGAFADKIDDGNLGLGILRNFIVTFDLADNAMYVEKGSAFDDGRHRTAISR